MVSSTGETALAAGASTKPPETSTTKKDDAKPTKLSKKELEAFQQEQCSVLTGMGVAMSLAILGIALTWTHTVEFPQQIAFPMEADRLDSLLRVARMLLFLALPLLGSIGRLAGRRFFTPQDINAAASGSATTPSDDARCDQAIIQNNLEQFALAVAAYISWASVMKKQAQDVLLFTCGAFLIGRVCFMAGYRAGAGPRSFGFAFTFYPTVLLFVCCVVSQAYWLLCGWEKLVKF